MITKIKIIYTYLKKKNYKKVKIIRVIIFIAKPIFLLKPSHTRPFKKESQTSKIQLKGSESNPFQTWSGSCCLGGGAPSLQILSKKIRLKYLDAKGYINHTKKGSSTAKRPQRSPL